MKVDDEDSIPVNSVNIISQKEKLALLNSLNHELSQNVEDFILLNPDKISSVILINEFLKTVKILNHLKEFWDILKTMF